MNRTNLSIFESLQDFLIHATRHRDRYCRRLQDFTRTRTFTFEVTAVMVLNLLQKSLALELHDFFGHLGVAGGTKSGFSKARRKIRHLFFPGVERFSAGEVLPRRR